MGDGEGDKDERERFQSELRTDLPYVLWPNVKKRWFLKKNGFFWCNAIWMSRSQSRSQTQVQKSSNHHQTQRKVHVKSIYEDFLKIKKIQFL